MSLTWTQRKARLSLLLNIQGDEDAEALVIDRLLHGQTVIGKTCKSEWSATTIYHSRDA